jgi:hypothetical protein
LPLRADQVSTTTPFTDGELLYRRVSPDELNSKGEVDPSRINAISFNKEVQSAPSVNRSEFSTPEDVLDQLCSNGKDVSFWFVFFVRVDGLPKGIIAGDGRIFNFLPCHVPLHDCGAHSVIKSCLATDSNNAYTKPTQAVINDFKVKFATKLMRIEQLFDISTKEKSGLVSHT